MDFLDNSWRNVQDRLPVGGWDRGGGIVWQVPYRNSTFEFRIRLAEHGVTLSDHEGQFNHFRPMFTRVFVYRRGCAELIRQNRSHWLVPGKIYVLPAGMSFHIHYQPRELIYYHLCLEDQTGCPVFEPDEPFLELDLPSIHQQFLDIQQADHDMVHVGVILSLISRFLPERLEELCQRNMKHRDFLRIFEYMDTHPLAQVTVAELAELCDLDFSTLSKRFRRKMGMSLKAFMQERLLRQACEHLLFSSQKVIDIAGELGFTDPAYFHHFFRRQTGLTPQQFRMQPRI